MSIAAIEEGDFYSAEGEFESTATPWSRYWSRMLDLTIWMGITGYAFGAMFPSAFLKLDAIVNGNDYLLGVALLPLAVIVDSLCIAAFGQTPGRALAGIRVLRMTGERITFGEAIARNFQVYVKGLALGIPIIALFTLLAAHSRVKSGQETSWDEGVGTRVIADGASLGRTILAAIFYLLIVGGIKAWTLEDARTLDQEMPRQEPLSAPDPIEDQLRGAAVELDKSLPKQIDSVTKLTDVRVDGRRMFYTYEISRRDTTDKEYLKFLSKNTTPKVCENANMRRAIDDFDVIYTYEYFLPHSPTPLSFSVDRAACRGI